MTSTPERIKKLKNLLNSAFVWPVDPSAKFNETESAALLICEVSTYNSSFGKVNVT